MGYLTAGGNVERKYVVNLLAKDGASSTLKRFGVAADGSVDKMKALNEASRVASLGLAAWAAAAVVSVKVAAEHATAMRNLTLAMQNTGNATQAQIDDTGKLITSLSELSGVSEDKIMPAMNRLVISTQSVTESQKLLQVAMDVSAATGKDISTVSLALGKAYNGNAASLGRLGFAYKDANGNVMTFDQIMQRVQTSTEGAAKAAGDAQPWNKLAVSVHEAQVNIGTGLLPVVKAASELLNRMGPGGITAAFAVTGVGLAAVAIIPKLIALNKWVTKTGMGWKSFGAGAGATTAVTIAIAGALETYAQRAQAAAVATDAWAAALATKSLQDDLNQVYNDLNRSNSGDNWFTRFLSFGSHGQGATADQSLQDIGTSLDDVNKALAGTQPEWDAFVAKQVQLATAAKEPFQQINNLSDALQGARQHYLAGSSATTLHAAALGTDAAAAATTTSRTKLLAQAQQDLYNKTEKVAAAFGDHQAALIAVDGAERTFLADLKKSSGEVFGHGKAVEQTRNDLIDWTKSIWAASDGAQNQTKFLEQHRQKVLDEAKAQGILNDKLRAYINHLLHIPKAVTTTVTAVGVPVGGSVPHGATTGATGGYVRGPGTGTSDSVPAYLSNGEYVIKAAAVQRYGRHMLDRVNAMHFAGGGMVNSSNYSSAIDKASANLLQKLTDNSDAAVAHLKDIRANMHDLSGSVRAAAVSGGQLSNISAPNGMHLSGAALKAGVHADLVKVRAFMGKLKQLARLGLSRPVIGQIIGMGPDSGLEYASALLSGGRELIGDIDRMEGSIARLGGSTGQSLAGHYYGSAAHQAAQHARDARRELRNAQHAVRDVKREVHIHLNASGSIVVSEKQLARMVRDELAKLDKANGRYSTP